MTRIELHEKDAGRILPGPTDERTTITAWAAVQALRADNRTKHECFRDLAARLIIVEVEG